MRCVIRQAEPALFLMKILFLGNWKSPITINAFKRNGERLINEDPSKVIDNTALTFFEDTTEESDELQLIRLVILNMKTAMEVRHIKIINKFESATISELSDGK